ncbi:MAG TPA: ATP-binding protein [Solirubrobacteraceae bacterium]|nr:ATP-binding protein [Solirubrobacteraceae bacterium]
MRAERAFPCTPGAVTAARRFVRELLPDQPRETAELAELMVSELATNCVQHARTPFKITVSIGSEIRVEVRDSGAGGPHRMSPTPQELSGRGLLIVESMADQWGVIKQPAGKTVWFALPVGRRDPTTRGGKGRSPDPAPR